MTYEEFQRQLGKAGLTSREFAALVRMNPNSVSNCARKAEVPSHWAVIVALMAEMAEHRLDFRKALAGVDIVPKKPRGAAAKGRFGGSKQKDLFEETDETSLGSS
ncbi:MAG: hypothetical protein WBG92_09965 [Thiohalocapsa sp.]